LRALLSPYWHSINGQDKYLKRTAHQLIFAVVILCPVFVALFHGLDAWAQGFDSTEESRFDGPAELPRVYVRTALADTRSFGQVVSVRQGDDLQAALNQASCGDTLKLQAGATFSGTFRLPPKPCDDAHWIILRTSAPDDSLPPEGTRITPCYAGVASLPGRPDFHCTRTRNVMAKIEFDGKSDSGAALVFLPGANHYRIIGLEITRTISGVSVHNLVYADEKGTADHIVFDRVWAHGNAQDETKGGVHLSDTVYTAVVDSFFSDFHCIAITGVCTDAQAINGGGGNHAGGPYKIVNNFLEASGENILFGGSAATTTPGDIEIRHNYLFKPMIWKPGQPGLVTGASGKPFIVKNHFELKNAQRVLFEGNVLENVWGGFSQTGFSILLTPKNQAPNVCPACRVTDITIRYSRISHVAGVLQIANGLSGTGGAAAAGERYSIHDLLVDDIDGDAYKGFGSFAIIGSATPLLKDVRIDHVTAFPPRVLFSILSSGDQPKMSGFSITNNIFSAGTLQVTSAGGGPRNCAFRADAQGPDGVFKSCFSNSIVTHNLIVGGEGWPRGNISAKNPSAAGFRSLPKGHGMDYRLCLERDETTSCKKPSPAVKAGTDGKDIGADIEAIEKATRGVI
jgi:hypothetical protein